jgi:RNA polymerase sigma-70 factor (ECF subfamily)
VVLLLTQALGWSAAEVAESLDTTVPAVNSALQRSRATLAARDLSVMSSTLTAEQSAMVARYVDAFERYDIQALTALLHDDAVMSMPPYALWLQGHASIAISSWAWVAVGVHACTGGATASAFTGTGDGREPWSLIVLELDGERIVA